MVARAVVIHLVRLAVADDTVGTWVALDHECNETGTSIRRRGLQSDGHPLAAVARLHKQPLMEEMPLGVERVHVERAYLGSLAFIFESVACMSGPATREVGCGSSVTATARLAGAPRRRRRAAMVRCGHGVAGFIVAAVCTGILLEPCVVGERRRLARVAVAVIDILVAAPIHPGRG